MKRFFYLFATLGLLAACTADDEVVESDGVVINTDGSIVEDSPFRESISANFNEGRLGVRVARGSRAASRAIMTENLYLDEAATIPATAENLTWKYVNLICNEAYGLMHGDNGWAAKDVATGSLDNSRPTYSWFYNDKGEQQNIVHNDLGILLVGDTYNLDEFNDGSRPVVPVGDAWFTSSFNHAQNFINAAKATEAKTGYYQLQNGGDNLKAPYTYYEYQGYTVVMLDYDMQNGSCVVTEKKYTWWDNVSNPYWPHEESVTESQLTDEQREQIVALGDAVTVEEVSYMNENMKAPWAEGHGESSWPTDGLTNTIDHKVVLVPTKASTTLSSRNINANIFAPGKELTIDGGGAPCGLVICDKIHIGAGTEIHGLESDDFGYSPIPTDEECEASVKIDIDIPGEYVVQADDFAIHNGDLLYERAAITDHEGVANGKDGLKTYVKVNADAGDKVEVAVEDLCELYPSYVGKLNSEGQPYISEDGVLTLEVYIWPGTINEENQFVSWQGLEEGYLIGEENAPVEYAATNKFYSVKVSAYKGYQGRGEKDDAETDNNGWSYIKVSVHIQPK